MTEHLTAYPMYRADPRGKDWSPLVDDSGNAIPPPVPHLAEDSEGIAVYRHPEILAQSDPLLRKMVAMLRFLDTDRAFTIDSYRRLSHFELTCLEVWSAALCRRPPDYDKPDQFATTASLGAA